MLPFLWGFKLDFKWQWFYHECLFLSFMLSNSQSHGYWFQMTMWLSMNMQQKVWYYEKWVGRHASFPLRQSVKRSQLCELVILQTVMYLDTLKNYLPKIVQSSFKFHKRMMFPYYTCTSRCHCTSILECKFVDYWSGVGGEGIYYAFSGYAKREFLGFAPFFFLPLVSKDYSRVNTVRLQTRMYWLQKF